MVLQREGMKVNHKRVLRLYREEGLSLRRRKRKRLPARLRRPLAKPTRAGQHWSMDFVSDTLADGRVFRMLNVVDDYSWECLAIEADISMPGLRVVRVVERLLKECGKPELIRTDNGPEFTGRALDQWAYESGVRLEFIRKRPNRLSFTHKCRPWWARALMRWMPSQGRHLLWKHRQR